MDQCLRLSLAGTPEEPMRRQGKRLLLAALLAATALAAGATQAAPRYELTLLPSPRVGTLNLNRAYDINNNGQVVGYAHGSDGETLYIYADGKVTVPFRRADGWAWGRGLNDRGSIVGAVCEGCEFPSAFIYRNGTFEGLRGLPGYDAYAQAINNAGQVIGRAGDYHVGNYYGFLYSKGKVITFFPDANHSTADAINEAGYVVGTFEDYAYNVKTFIYQGGRTRVLPVPPLTFPTSINRWTHIVGSVGFAGVGRAFRLRAGVMEDLGALGDGESSWASAINDAGRVVGTSGHAPDFTRPRAFIHVAGRMHDLNTLTRGRGGFVLQNATGINNPGQIIGSGAYPGEPVGSRPFLLNPIPMPAP
jgi:probable HAF family extracellular repeat protein